jgi:hypothetical protein
MKGAVSQSVRDKVVAQGLSKARARQAPVA